MKLEEKLRKISKKIGRKHGIEYLLFFGSYSIGYQLEESDVDIAVKLKSRPKNFKEKLRTITKISSEIERGIDKEVDLIILNDANPGLKFEIFRTGKILYYERYNRLVEDKSRAIAEYQDFSSWSKPMFDSMIKGILHGGK